MMRKLKCWFGFHAPDTIKEEGDRIVQRCLYCDRVVHQFERDPEGWIRRKV